MRKTRPRAYVVGGFGLVVLGCAAPGVSVSELGPVGVELRASTDDELYVHFDVSQQDHVDEDTCRHVDVRIGFDDEELEAGADYSETEWLFWTSSSCLLPSASVPYDADGPVEGAFWLESLDERRTLEVVLPTGPPELRATGETSIRGSEPIELAMPGYELLDVSAELVFRHGGRSYDCPANVDVDEDRVAVAIPTRSCEPDVCPEGCDGSLEVEYAYSARILGCDGFSSCTTDAFEGWANIDVTWQP